MATKAIVKVDARSSLRIPEALRHELSIEPGDLFSVEADEAPGVLRFAKVENPFDILAEHSMAEYRAGRTTSLRDFAVEHGFSREDE